VAYGNWVMDIKLYFAQDEFFIGHYVEAMRVIVIDGGEDGSGFRGYTLGARSESRAHGTRLASLDERLKLHCVVLDVPPARVRLWSRVG
jgi:hypothetical protein